MFGSVAARIDAWLCIAALAVLSWTPGDYMLRTEVLTGHEEHFLAYLISGAVIAAAPRRSSPVPIAILLWLYAGVLELGQNFVAGPPSRLCAVRIKLPLSRTGPLWAIADNTIIAIPIGAMRGP